MKMLIDLLRRNWKDVAFWAAIVLLLLVSDISIEWSFSVVS